MDQVLQIWEYGSELPIIDLVYKKEGDKRIPVYGLGNYFFYFFFIHFVISVPHEVIG